MITKPNTLSDAMVRLILPFIEEEYIAFYHYRAAGNWCKGVGFDKAAEFYFKESETELSHAKSLEQFLVDWNVICELPEVEVPKLEYESLPETIYTSYELEYSLFEKYKKGSRDAFGMGEMNVFQLLMNKVNTQNESVIEYSDKMNMLEGVELNKTNLLLLEKKLFN